MRFAIPLLLAWSWVAPVRAESLRAPVDADVWRVIDGAGDGASRRIGCLPFGATLLLAAPAAALGGFVGVLAGAAVGMTGVLPLTLATTIGVSILMVSASEAVVAVLGGSLAKIRPDWTLAAIVGAVCAALTIGVLAIPSVGGNMVPAYLTMSGAVAVTAIAIPFAAFGPPAFALWSAD